MAPPNNTQLEAAVAALSERVRREIELVEAQIIKSRAARGYTPMEGQPSVNKAKASAAAERSPTAAVPSASGTNGVASPQQQRGVPTVDAAAPSPVVAATAQPSSTLVADVDPMSLRQKHGPLLNFGRPRMFPAFASSYVLVDEAKGIAWWDNAEDYQRNPTKPKDAIPFFEIAMNSRASKFKKAVTCWPLILPEDCPKATDPAVSYFGLEYYVPKTQKTELLVLGARSAAERDQWVTYITKYVKLFLSNREESTQFLNFAVGSATPVHVSAVLDGEAPR